MHRAIVLASMVVTLCCALATPARAQTTPPDLVELTNGGMLRGTIVENLPGDHVTIQLATGEVRTFPSAQVQHAGPAPVAPAPPTAPAEVIPPAPAAALAAPTRAVIAQPGPLPMYGAPQAMGPTVRVHVESTSPELTLQMVTGTGTAVMSTGRMGFTAVMIDNFAPLCTAPCDVDLPARTYVLGVSQGQGGARRGDHNLFSIDTDQTLEIEYDSREGWRIAGWLFFIGGAIAGAGIMLGGILDNARDFVTWLIAGSVVLGVSEIVGLALAFLNDHADIRRMDGTVRF